MRYRFPFTTHVQADEDAGLGDKGTIILTIGNVYGYLESVQYIKPASGGMGNSSNIGVFLYTDLVNPSDFPIYFNTACAASFLAYPRALEQKHSDGSNLTTYGKQYFSGDNILIAIDDTADNPAGGTTGTIILRFSGAEPVRR